MNHTQTIWKISSINPSWEVCAEGFMRRISDKTLIAPRITTSTNGQQYRFSTFRNNKTGNRTSIPIAHFILFEFVEQRPSPKHVAVHINGDTTDDAANNLKWMTRSDAAHYSTNCRYGNEKASTVRSRGGNSSIPDSTVRQICADIKAGTMPYSKIANEYNVSKAFVTQIANGHRRAKIAIESGLVFNNANMIVNAWPYLDENTRLQIQNLVANAHRPKKHPGTSP